jgi:uncharacterized membrane protein
MKGRLGRLTDALAENLLLVPLLAFLIAFGLSRGLLVFDRTLDTSVRVWFVYGGSPQGARQLLATLAGSMITFTGLVFSSTILVLQLASSQFTPRIMRTFFRDRVIQGALGTFIATFAYAILVLREVREEPGHSFVPGLSTYVAISLVWLSLAMFVAYINHIAERIRAVSIIAIAAQATSQTLQRLHAKRPPQAVFERPASPGQLVCAPAHGLVADVDAKTLLKFACTNTATLEVVPLAGDFLSAGSPLVRVWCERELSGADIEAIAECVAIERDRTMRSDVLFGFRQLVDIADKALSPGINDPTTAVQVLDQLHELLRCVADRGPRSDAYGDDGGTVRVFVPSPSWAQYLDEALEEILLYGHGSIHVMRRLRVLVIDLEKSVGGEYRLALSRYRERIDGRIDATFDDPADRDAARRLPRSTNLRPALTQGVITEQLG